MHDGPGLRTVIFLKGCPLRCAWCHNPETQAPEKELLFYAKKCISCAACVSVCPQNAHRIEEEHRFLRERCASCFACASVCPSGALEVTGREYTAEELLCEVMRDAPFYGETGGLTLSGGEPLMQTASLTLLHLAKEAGISTALETCGYADPARIAEAVPYTDLFLYDIKDTDPVRHSLYTGKDNRLILENLKKLDSLGARTRLRCILVNGINTEKVHYRRLADLARSLSFCEGVEFLPYHAYGGSKATFLGRADNGRAAWIPTDAQLSEAKACVAGAGVHVL